MKKILWAIPALAVIVRVYLFIFVEKSLWLDEAALALNILDKGYLELFQPLQYAQSAPPLFLLCTKFLTEIFGTGERVFRLIPLLCSIGAVFGFYFLLCDVFKEKKWCIIFGLIIFSSGFPLLYNAIEFKPYAVDVLFTILAALIWFKCLNKNISLKKQILHAVVLILFPLFSFGSIFSLCAILTLSLLKKRKTFSFILFFGLLIEYLFIFSKINSGTRVYEYWVPYFINYNPIKAVFILIDIIKYLFYPSSFALIILAGFIAGLTILFKKNKEVFKFFSLIILYGFLASFFNFYPLYERLSLFLYPIILIIVLSPLYYVLFEKNSIKKAVIFLLSGAIVISACFYNFINPNLYKREEIKPLLLKMRNEIQPQDKIFVFKGAHLTYRYYNRIFKFQNEAYVCPYNISAETCAKKIKPFCGQNTCFVIYSSEVDTENNVKILEETVSKLNGKILQSDKNSVLYKLD